jgi:hypothetical protein
MSLFLQLQRLYRSDRFLIEDFHTEIVAQALRNLPELTLEWLRYLGVTVLAEADYIQITTQETYTKLSWHETDSRPDMVIRLGHGDKIELVFVESKLPSQQGSDQLQRYADHLKAALLEQGVSQATLVFITREYEAPPPALMADPRFKLTRWFQFYHFLKKYAEQDGVARELKLFMQEHRMSLGNKLCAVDLVGLENFVKAKLVLDETLEGEVMLAASQLLGKTSFPKAVEEVNEDPRYVVHHGKWGDSFVFLFGYWFPNNDPDGSVWLGMTIYSNPQSASRAQVRELFRSWGSGGTTGWLCSVRQEKEWATLAKGKSLQAFLGEQDHIRAIKDYFLLLLQEAQQFRVALAALEVDPGDLVARS